MKIMRTLIVLTCVVIFAACNAAGSRAEPPSQAGGPYSPQPGDSKLMRGEIRVDSAEIRLAESYPVQVMLHVAYFLPTPCYELRVQAGEPDSQNRINIEAYALAEKDKPCTLMALATPLEANLNLGSYPKGHYSIWLNGARVGEFDS